MGIAAEKAEGKRNNPGINGRMPSRGAGVAAKRRAEAQPVGEGVGNAANFPPKTEISIGGAELVGMSQGNVEDTYEEADGDHPGGGLEDGTPAASRCA